MAHHAKRADPWPRPWTGIRRPARPFNAITDIANVEVGYTTLIRGSGPLVRGTGPVRTGVTAILPRGRERAGLACAAGGFSLNGNGEMTGMIWVEEFGRTARGRSPSPTPIRRGSCAMPW